MTDSRRIVLITNPGSGRAARDLSDIQSCLARERIEVLETIPIKELDRLPHRLASVGDEQVFVVAAGGDGTIGSVASYLVDKETVLGILPVGTSNDIARSLGIPLEIPEAVHLLTDGQVSRVDVGRFQAHQEGSREEPRYFLHAATAGINVAFARMATRSSFRERLGKFAYLAAALAALRDVEPFACEVEIDGRRTAMTLLQLCIVNAPVFGGLLGLELPGSSIDDHRLDVLAIESMPVLRIAVSALPVLLGRHTPVKGIRVFHVQNISVHPREPLSVTLDGEVAAKIPGAFSLRAEALHVICPGKGV